jgi:hypothetical protein
MQRMGADAQRLGGRRSKKVFHINAIPPPTSSTDKARLWLRIEDLPSIVNRYFEAKK